MISVDGLEKAFGATLTEITWTPERSLRLRFDGRTIITLDVETKKQRQHQVTPNCEVNISQTGGDVLITCHEL